MKLNHETIVALRESYSLSHGKTHIKLIAILSVLIFGILVLFSIGVFAKEDDTTLTITVKDEVDSTNLPNAKFSIKHIVTNEDGLTMEEDAVDINGNLVGNIENINGTDYRVVTTDVRGEINLQLPSGKYRVIQIKATDGYELNENNTYEIELVQKGTYTLPTVNKEWEYYYNNFDCGFIILDIQKRNEESYDALIENGQEGIITSDMTADNSEIYLLSNRYYILEYNKENKIEKAILLEDFPGYVDYQYIIKVTDNNIIMQASGRNIEFLNNNGEEIFKLDYENYGQNDDNIILQTFKIQEGENIIPQELMANNTETSLETGKSYLIKINEAGKIEQINESLENENLTIEKIYLEKNNDINMYVEISGDVKIPAEKMEDNEERILTVGTYVLSINSNNKIKECTRNLGEEFYNNYHDEILDSPINYLSNGKIISNIITEENININSRYSANGTSLKLNAGNNIVKFNKEGKIEWAFNMLYADYTILETDNGYIIKGYFEKNISKDNTLSGKEIEVQAYKPYEIKLSKEGKVIWVNKLQEASDYEVLMPTDQITLDNNKYVKLYSQGGIENRPAPATITNQVSVLQKYSETFEEKEDVEQQAINVTNTKEDTLQIIKKDEETGAVLQGAKFTINKIVDNTKEEAKDIYGKTIGNIENINGTDYRVVTTDENGEINLQLPEGKYEVTEVKAPEGYKIDENPTHEININLENTSEVFYSEKIFEKNYGEDVTVLDSKEDKNGGFTILVGANANYIIPAEETTNGIAIQLEEYDMYLIKYNSNNKIEKVIRINNIDYNYYFEKIIKVTDEYTIVEDYNGIYSIDNYGNIQNIIENLYLQDVPIDMGISNTIETKDKILINSYIDYEVVIPAEKTENNQEITLQGNVIFEINSNLKISNVINLNDEINVQGLKNIENSNNFNMYVSVDGNTTIPAKLMENSKEANLNSGAYILQFLENGKIEEIKSFNINLLNDISNNIKTGYYAQNLELLVTVISENDITIKAENTVVGKDVIIPAGINMLKINSEGKFLWNIPGGLVIKSENNNSYYAYIMTNGTINADMTENNSKIKLGDTPAIALAKINSDGKIIYAINRYNINSMMEFSEVFIKIIEEKILNITDNRYVILGKDGNNNLKSISSMLDSAVIEATQITVYQDIANNIEKYNKQLLTVTNKPEPTEVPEKPDEPTIGTVIVRYLDKETNEELLPTETMKQRIGTRYATNGKEVQYYKLDGTPLNAEGTVNSGVTEVIYYYEKQNFNIQTDKTISELYVNGEEQKLSDTNKNIFQVSIHRKDIPNAELKIKYKIVITNSGEIPGTAGKITDMIPEGLEFYAEDNEDYWYLENGYAVTNVLDGVEIQPGESRELEIVLRCEEVGDNMGLKTNRAVAENTKNGANFAETTTEDNESGCRLIVAESLGLEDYVIEILQRVLAALVVAGTIIITLKIKERRK